MKIYYKNSKGTIINLDSAPYYLTENSDLLDYSWDYDKNYNKVENLQKKTDEKSIQVAVVGTSKDDCYAKLDYFFAETDVDCVYETPGTLHFGDYYIHCYLIGNKKNGKYIGNAKVLMELQVLRVSNAWIKETNKEFIYAASSDAIGRGYPYGYPYDYTAGSGNTGMLLNEHFGPCDFMIRISGYAFEPAITIADHIYKINATIQEKEILTIDSRDKSIMLTRNKEKPISYFSKREKSSYIFEKIPSGYQKVYWNSDFNFDITLFEERSEPKWI